MAFGAPHGHHPCQQSPLARKPRALIAHVHDKHEAVRAGGYPRKEVSAVVPRAGP
jgi:hypothetical protein